MPCCYALFPKHFEGLIEEHSYSEMVSLGMLWAECDTKPIQMSLSDMKCVSSQMIGSLKQLNCVPKGPGSFRTCTATLRVGFNLRLYTDGCGSSRDLNPDMTMSARVKITSSSGPLSGLRKHFPD